MKALKFILVFFAINLSVFAQPLSREKLPPGLIYEFENKYQGVNEVLWELSQDKYIAKFQFNSRQCIAYYNMNTKWLKTETKIPTNDLPRQIERFMLQNFRNHFIVDALFIESSESQPYYYLTTNENNILYYFKFDADGYFIELRDNEKEITNEMIASLKKKSSEDKSKQKSKKGNPNVIPASEVPANILSDFEKKVKKYDKIVWERIDTIYRVTYIEPTKKQTNFIEYSKDGKWLKSAIVLSPKDLNQNILKQLTAKYEGFEIYMVASVTIPPKNKYTEVQIFNPKWLNDPMVFHKIYFSTSGKIEKEILANYIEASDKAGGNKSDFFDYVDEDLSIDVDYQQILPKELPSKIFKHVTENYKNHTIQQAFIITDEQTKKTHYWVIIKQEGFKQQKKLIYDFKGNFLEEKNM